MPQRASRNLKVELHQPKRGINWRIRLLVIGVALAIVSIAIRVFRYRASLTQNSSAVKPKEQSPSVRAPVKYDTITKESFGSLQNPNKP